VQTYTDGKEDVMYAPETDKSVKESCDYGALVNIYDVELFKKVE
jgi:hypothetical protein